MSGVFIIAEAGVNHNGSLNTAKKMIEKAKEAGADCVKFQTFIAEKAVSVFAEKAKYQKERTNSEESQLDMIRKLELPFDDFQELNRICIQNEIEFLSTPFDLESVDFLENLNIKRWKIPSGEITNYPYLVRIAKTKKPIIMSTGMCDLSEIKDSLSILRENGANDISLLQCTTEYPVPFKDVNLNAMKTIRDELNVTVGYSDHTIGIEIPIAATALGAKIIEKHFTLDKNMDGPDHQMSIAPDEFAEMVKAIRNVEAAFGNGKKTIMSSESENIQIARKSIVAARDIREGELFTEENLTTKRPGNGVSPMLWPNVLGTKAKRNYAYDEKIEIET